MGSGLDTVSTAHASRGRRYTAMLQLARVSQRASRAGSKNNTKGRRRNHTCPNPWVVAPNNVVNRKRKYRAWWISKTRAFYAFTILHNIFLAIYSGVTCAAMVRALHVSVSTPVEEHGIPGTLDSLCKMSGPRGLGNAAYFNPESNIWETKNPKIHLGLNALPDTSDVGRIWNEGLGFWGWLFYLSKFCTFFLSDLHRDRTLILVPKDEVVDTFIILLKGKRSATLQTYHHAGAMLCMWAGIRYMSPPIWMFVFINSAIHAMMVSVWNRPIHTVLKHS